MYNLKFKWTTSKARDSYGYNVCTLLVDSEKSPLQWRGLWYERDLFRVLDRKRVWKDLLKFKQDFYGLTYHDPNWQPSKEIIKREEEGKSLGLERYQDFYKQSSKLPTEKHTIPQINGACGFSSVEKILNHLGFKISCIDYDCGVYLVNKGLK